MTTSPKLYKTARWHETSRLVRKHNPICQAIGDDGRQCMKSSELVHHLVDPIAHPELAYAWENLVAICWRCHHPGKGDLGRGRYVATLGPCGAVYQHGHGLPEWHKEHERSQLPDPMVPKAATTTSVGEDALDRALAEPI